MDKHDFRKRASCLVVTVSCIASLLVAFGYAQQRSTTGQAGGTGPPLRIDFTGSRSMPAVQPTPAPTANSAGPPLRVDFAGSRSMPAVWPAPSTTANSAGPPLRIDFSGTRAMPSPVRK